MPIPYLGKLIAVASATASGTIITWQTPATEAALEFWVVPMSGLCGGHLQSHSPDASRD